MPIYVTKQIQNVSNKTEGFTSRGLTGSSSATVPQAQIYALGHPTPGFLIQVANMQNELSVMVTKSTRYGHFDTAQDVLYPLNTDSFPIRPTLVINSSDEVKEQLTQRGLRPGEKTGLYIGTPTESQAKEIMALGVNDSISVPAGNTNLTGYIAFLWLVKGINGYLRFGGGDAKDFRYWIGGGFVKEKYELVKKNIADGKDTEANANYGLQGVLTDPDNIRAYKVPSARLLMNDPSQYTPSAPGHFFEYFPEMMDGDPEYAFGIFTRIFRFCLGPDTDTVAERLKYIRKGARNVCNTAVGRVLQHMYLGVDLTSTGGGVVDYIFEGSQYKGFVLIGAGAILNKGMVLGPKAVDVLSKEIRGVAAHKEALSAISALLVALSDQDGNTVTFDVDKASINPRYIRQVVQSISAADIEGIKTSLADEIKKLRYSQTFWTPTSDNMVTFIRALSSKQVWTDQPLYCTAEIIVARSEIINYLAAFGPTAPSIFNGNVTRSIAKPGTEDPNLKVVGDVRAVPYIPVYLKGIMAAAADWASVSNTSSFKFVGAQKKQQGVFANRQKDSGIIGGSDFLPFYELLRVWVHSGRSDRTEAKKGKGKRKATDVDMDSAGPSKKVIKML